MDRLQRYRKDRAVWQDLAYQAARSDERGSHDANEKQRYAVLIQLQYDWRQADRELIRFLFEQEVIARENDSFQGIGEALCLGAFLLAKYRAQDDIPLFCRARHANFDTACGFDIEFVFWPLKKDTETWLAQNHPESLKLLESVSFESNLEETIDQWWRDQVARYPDCEDKEEPLVLYERYLYCDEIGKARVYLDIWAAREPESERKTSYLRYAYLETYQFDKAISLIEGELQALDGGWDKACAYRDLLAIYTVAGAPAGALTCVEGIATEFRLFEDWKQAGLGHIAVRSVFEYAQACPDPRVAKKAFDYADAWSKEIGHLPYAALEVAWHAAQKCGLSAQAEGYSELAKQALAEIESL